MVEAINAMHLSAFQVIMALLTLIASGTFIGFIVKLMDTRRIEKKIDRLLNTLKEREV